MRGRSITVQARMLSTDDRDKIESHNGRNLPYAFRKVRKHVSRQLFPQKVQGFADTVTRSVQEPHSLFRTFAVHSSTSNRHK